MGSLHRTIERLVRIGVAAKLTMISAKTYKKRLRDYNCRKNIRSTESDAEAFQHLLAAGQHPAPAHVKLSNGRKWPLTHSRSNLSYLWLVPQKTCHAAT